ncbi:hypothetical protein V1477_009569 [Vespula maculifrons]|uniref:Uncharacterized protein n=1 Tax=Vespula maculifrons TaxID=7453 RepID=A0ABD2CAV5_VESMC
MPNVCQIIAGCRACRLGFNNRVDKEPKKIEEEAECSASPARTRGGGRPDWILLLFEILVRKRSPHHRHINQPWLPRIEDRGCTPFVVIPRGLLHALSMPLFWSILCKVLVLRFYNGFYQLEISSRVDEEYRILWLASKTIIDVTKVTTFLCYRSAED